MGNWAYGILWPTAGEMGSLEFVGERGSRRSRVNPRTRGVSQDPVCVGKPVLSNEGTVSQRGKVQAPPEERQRVVQVQLVQVVLDHPLSTFMWCRITASVRSHLLI